MVSGEEDDVPEGMIVDTRYEIRRRVARGGMGEILCAWDQRLKRTVAMKVLAPYLSTDEWADRFRVEAETMAKIEHPGIVPLHDIGVFPDGRLYYIMKFIDGCTLCDEISKCNDQKRLLSLLCEVARIIHFAHERGVIHRDLKPSNIMLDNQSKVYVMDWGLARARNEAILSYGDRAPAPAGLTSPGTILGTLEYMPPEQARGDVKNVDQKSDIYSLGAILYEILTHRPPILGSTISERLAAAEKGDIIPPRGIAPDIHRDLDAICCKALSRSREDRYETADLFAKDLQNAIEGEPTVARPRPPLARGWRKVRKHKTISIAFLLLGMVTLAFTTWVVLGSVQTSRKIDEYLVNARQYEQKGDLEKARDSYRKILDLREEHAGAKAGFQRATLLMELRKKNIESAEAGRILDEKEARRLIEASRTPLRRALEYMRSEEASREELLRRVDRAQELLSEATTRAPRISLGHYLLGLTWELKGKEDLAEKCWREAIRIDPDFGHPHYRLGRLLLRRNFLASLYSGSNNTDPIAMGAKKALDTAIASAGFEDALDRHTAIAMLAYLNDQADLMVRIAHNGTDLYEGKVGTEDLYWLGAMALTGDARIRAYDQALKLRPFFPLALASRGHTHLSMDLLDEAVRDFSRAIRLDPENPWHHLGRGWAFEKKKNGELATKNYREALRIAPSGWSGLPIVRKRLELLERSE